MSLATIQWHRSFPYHDGAVSITRLSHGWRVRKDEREEEAASLIDAFEAVRERRISQHDLSFILNVLTFDISTTAHV
jgi:hypothetical protein